MKKILVILLVLGVAGWLGCSDTMGDQQGTNSANGLTIDLVGGDYRNDFNQPTYTDLDDEVFTITSGRLTMFESNGMADDTYDSRDVTPSAALTPNYGVDEAANIRSYAFPMNFEVSAQFAATDEDITLATAPQDENENQNGAIAAKFNTDLSGIGASANSVLLIIGTSSNAAGIVPVARADFPDFLVDTEFVLNLTVGANGSATQGPDITVSIDGTAVIVYEGETGTVTTGTELIDAYQDGILAALTLGTVTDDNVAGDGLLNLIWDPTWENYIWGPSQAGSTQRIGFQVQIGTGASTDQGRGK